MPLVNSRDILLPAFREGRAVGAFNANNMEIVQAIIWAAEEVSRELSRPVDVIIQVSPGAARYAGWSLAAGMVKIAAAETDVRVALNLDHATEIEQVKRALEEGFTSVLFDGSSLPLEENIRLTRQVVEMCHSKGVPVEAEVGKIPKIEDYFTKSEIAHLRSLPPADAVKIIRERTGKSFENLLTKPDEAEYFVRKTECDFLAVSFGSIHGMWDDILPIKLNQLIAIKERVRKPLVSHGSSGILMTQKAAEIKGITLLEGEGTLLDAIKLGGITKINVATAVSIAFINGFIEAWRNNPGEKDFRKLGEHARNRVKEKVKEYVKLFSAGEIY
ncbi:MAG: class II fructose-bisphosphate aldolase [Candidatus Bathyarchaeia archaeon]|nr:class II fructose-bisphosphate aldolase [Candidatus Bathyarchaeota archaeon]